MHIRKKTSADNGRAYTTAYAFTGMTPGTSYTFNVYPVNNAGVPSIATVVASPASQVSASGTVTTGYPPIVWAAVSNGSTQVAYSSNALNWTLVAGASTSNGWGMGYGNGIFVINITGGTPNFAYSTNAVTWTGCTSPVYSGVNNVQAVAYSSTQNRWGAAMNSALAYSSDGVNWSTATTTYGMGLGIAAGQDMWVGGMGSSSALVYSKNGTNWSYTANYNTIFSTKAEVITYSPIANIWVAGGSGSVNTTAYSSNGYTWTGTGVVMSGTNGQVFGVAYGGYPTGFWIAGAITGANTLGYSTDGITWTGLGKVFNSITFNQIFNVNFSQNARIWTVCGIIATSNNGAYSTNGFNWTVIPVGGFSGPWVILSNN